MAIEWRDGPAGGTPLSAANLNRMQADLEADLKAYADNAADHGGSGESSVLVGPGANASGGSSVSVGRDADASGLSSVAIGHEARTSWSFSSAFGPGSQASTISGVAVGHNSKATGSFAVAVGRAAQASVGVAIGYQASADAATPIFIGGTRVKLRVTADGAVETSSDAGGTWETLVSARAPGSASNPHTDPDAARNDALATNWWVTTTRPTNMQAGDFWVEPAS